jgi:hypothetical protein
MKVSEFIEWLKTQDQDATVEVVVHESGTGYYDQGGWCYWRQFSGELKYEELPYYGEHFEYDSQHKTLYLGRKE